MKALHRLFDLAAWLAAGSLIATLAMVLLGIAGRLWPVLSLPGSDAYAGYCTAAAAFLSLAPTLRRGEHIRVMLVLQRLPEPARRGLELAVHALGLALATGLAWFSLRLVWQSRVFHDISTGLDATPLWIPQLAMAAGTVLLVLALAVLLIEHLRGQPAPATPGDEPVRVE